MAGKKIAFLILGIMGVIASLYLIAQNVSDVQQADKNVDIACQVLKNSTIRLQHALKAVEDTGGATSEQMQQVSNSIQDYNDRCASKSGVL